MKHELSYQIASVPDREKLVAERWLDNEMWGEINQEGNTINLELYPKPDGGPWRFPAEAVEKLLRMARCDLLGLELPDDKPDVA